MKITHALRLSAASLLLVASTSSCAVTHDVFAGDLAMSASYSDRAPLDATVYLVIDEFFETYVWNYGGTSKVRDTYRVPVGEAAARQAEVVARNAFASVQVVREAPSAGLVLIPEIARMTRSSPAAEVTTAVQLRWELRKDGDAVWTTEQNGMGRGNFGTVFTIGDRLSEQVGVAMDEAFRRSYEAILDSPEVRSAAR